MKRGLTMEVFVLIKKHDLFSHLAKTRKNDDVEKVGLEAPVYPVHRVSRYLH